MNGLHLMADLRCCRCAHDQLIQPELLAQFASEACAAVGLAVVNSLWHHFGAEHEQSGFTGVLLLAESHVAMHTWPELRSVTLDVYVCNYSLDNSSKARALLEALQTWFCAAEVQLNEVTRGFEP